MEVHLDRERILADDGEIRQAAGAVIGGDRRPRRRTRRVAFAIAGDPGVGIDTNERPPILELERLDFSDLAQARGRRGQHPETGENSARRHAQRRSRQSSGVLFASQ